MRRLGNDLTMTVEHRAAPSLPPTGSKLELTLANAMRGSMPARVTAAVR